MSITPTMLALVEREARQIARLMPPEAVEFSDLEGYGRLGLVEAKARFDPLRGVNFEAFARHRIRGAIFDGLRQALGPLRFRTYRRLQRQLMAWRLAGDPPTDRGDPEAMAQVTFSAIADLATTMLVERAEQRRPEPDPEQRLVDKETLARVSLALAALSAEDQAVIRAIYDLDESEDSGAALARRWKMHRSGVSRRHRRALKQLRRLLSSPSTGPPTAPRAPGS